MIKAINNKLQKQEYYRNSRIQTYSISLILLIWNKNNIIYILKSLKMILLVSSFSDCPFFPSQGKFLFWQVGVAPLHCPFLQVISLEPTSRKFFLQRNRTFRLCLKSLALRLPYLGVPGFGHGAEIQKKNETIRLMYEEYWQKKNSIIWLIVFTTWCSWIFHKP